MNTKKTVVSTVVCLACGVFSLFLPETALAQSRDDRQVWGSVKIEKELTKRWRVAGEYQMRFEDNASNLRGHYFSAEAGYRFFRFLEGEAEYRFITAAERNANRVRINLIAKARIRKVTLSWRTGFQRQFEDFADADVADQARNYWRNRFQAKWKFAKRWAVLGAWEPFYRIDPEGNDSKFDRLRYTAGLEWEFVENHHFGASYLYQPQINRRSPRTFHIFNFEYAWEIPYKKDKKEKKEQPNK
ncbi:MAG: DUF2490 domain-containing protein [Cytophagales bacterium]|jgi:hypothetical protein|nr:DUF2490 domain-containing protein [Cytophagales bacterium]